MTTTEQAGFDEQRIRKRDELIASGINPYPYSFRPSVQIDKIIRDSVDCEALNRPLPDQVAIIGRIWAQRVMGGTVFADLRDESGKIQLYFNRKDFAEKAWSVHEQLDLGDLIGVSGGVFRTRSGELSIRVQELVILAKTVVPIPIGKETEEKHFYRIADPESHYRERYLTWMLRPEERSRIVRRATIIGAIRKKMEADGFLEVQTPTIEFVYGGAEARPFRTSIWALDGKDAFLRISPELYLKRYLVAGFRKVFCICQNFRNEGIDHSHNPEFTMMEWYEAYTDYEAQMQRFEELVSGVCRDICGSTKVEYQGVELDFTPPWPRLRVLEALQRYGEINAAELSLQQLRGELDKRGIAYREPLTWGVAVVELFEALCEDQLVQPTFVMDHPREISPLTKVKRGDPRLVERFEPYAFKMEIGNAYSELTDPVEQLERLVEQRRDADEYETHPIDLDFIKAIGCGMPPTGGVGLGIDRLVMLLTDSSSIRDIIPFPMVKPRVVRNSSAGE